MTRTTGSGGGKPKFTWQTHVVDLDVLHDWRAICRIYHKADVEFEGDFSQRLLILTRAIAERYRAMKADLSSLTSADITRIVYLRDICALKISLSKYLRFKDEV